MTPASEPRTLRVAILGVGLIGGSLGMALRSAAGNRSDADSTNAGSTNADKLVVVGLDEPDVLQRAIELGAIDKRAANPKHAVQDADVVFLAAPLSANVRLLSEIAPHLQPGAVVTDMGSVKTPIKHEAADRLPDSVTFVGGHPMAGSEKSGIGAANAFLFENATYVLCPGGADVPTALVRLIQSIGARILVLDADQHDRIAATTSHLPQLLAVALSGYAAHENEADDNVHRLAAGGFRDMTRVADSSFDLWAQILAANHGPVLDALAGFSADLQRLRNRLAAEEYKDVRSRFDNARTFRESVPKSTKGFLRPLADVFVSAADRPGALNSITRVLFENDLNIKDIELLKLREGTGGTFRIGFDSDAEAERAIAVLVSDGHTAHTL